MSWNSRMPSESWPLGVLISPRDDSRPITSAVLDIATIVAAPSAAALLGDYGAEVVKLEIPAGPDGKGGDGTPRNGTNASTICGDGLVAGRYLAEAGATAVIQPGGSVRDQEVVDAAADRTRLTVRAKAKDCFMRIGLRGAYLKREEQRHGYPMRKNFLALVEPIRVLLF